MAKRPKCWHGNNVLKMSGCAYCVMSAMESLQILRDIGCTAEEMLMVLNKHYKTFGELRLAIELAKIKAALVSKRTKGATKQ